MAEDATIIQAIETLQTALQSYDPSYTGGVTGELSPEFFDTLQSFTQGFQNIEGIATVLNQSGHDVQGIYDSVLGQTLNDFLTGDALEPIRLALTSPTGEAIASALLRSQDAPDQFIENPALLLTLIDQDLAGIIAAMNTLDEAGQLSVRPREFTPEQIADQPAAIEAIETQLKTDIGYFVDLMNSEIDKATQALEDLPDDAPAEDRERLTARIENIENSIEGLATSYAAIEDIEPDDVFDPIFREALTNYTSFLQSSNHYSAYVTRTLEEGEVPAPEDYVDTSGSYTEEYEQFLIQRLDGYSAYLEELNVKDPADVTDDERLVIESLGRIQSFTDTMANLVESGIYVQPDQEERPEQLDVVELDVAREIIEAAIGHMVRHDKVEVRLILGDRDNGDFDLASRIALQAFLIDLKDTLDIDVEAGSGLYSRDFRDALQISLQDEAARRRVAEIYFKGDEAMVAQLMVSLNTYMTDDAVANLPGAFTGNIGETELISKPQMQAIEVRALDVAIDRVPMDELAGMNEMMITLTGFGMEDFMPEGTLNDDQILAMEHAGQSREQVLGDLFNSIEAEARQALERDGRPMSELEGEMQERMVERFNNLVEDNASFNVIRAEYMRNYIEDAVSAGLEAKLLSAGATEPDQLQIEAGAAAFASTLPTAEEFLVEHGANRRSYFVYDTDDMQGVTPEVLQGFGGQIEKVDATIAEALSGQTISQLIDDMSEDFERLSSSPIGQRTIGEVRESLAEMEAMLGRVYNDPSNADYINDDGQMVITDRNGETVLLAQGEAGIEVRYLDAAGIESLSDFENDVFQIGEEFDIDQMLIRTAMAGYQSLNQGVDFKRNHNPEFFEMGGTHYVVGIDKTSNSIQLFSLDPEVLSPSNAASIAYSTSTDRSQEVRNDLMNDDAYRFLREQYGDQLVPAGSPDRVFEMMTRQLSRAGSVEADTALNVLAEYHDIDWANFVSLDDVPASNDEMLIARANMMMAGRPDDLRTEPFIYLKEGVENQIVVVTPALKLETNINDDSTETTVTVYDPDSPPMVQNITDPALYQYMRDEFLTTEVINQAALDTPAFQDLHDWLSAGGRPPIRQAPEVIDHGPATEEGLASLFESASGFTTAGRDMGFGVAITETATLVEVLGYDPNIVFAQNNLVDPENSYVVHGVEPTIWEGSEDHHEFLQNHILVTLQRDGEIVTIAVDKEDIANNPMRIPFLIDMEHGHENRSNPTVYAADRDHITTSDDGMFVPVQDFRRIAQGDYPVIRDGFWDDQSFWEKTDAWNRDVNALRNEIEAEEAALEEASEPLHQTLIRANSDDITAPVGDLSPVDDSVSYAANLGATRPVN